MSSNNGKFGKRKEYVFFYITKKHTILIALGVLVIIFFQIKKKINTTEIKKESISEYDILLDHQPVYKDSVYYIYISKIHEIPKIIYLKKTSINDVQRESKFFVHVYPKDSTLLKENQNLLAFDFKNNVKEYTLRGKKVFISELVLPDIGMKVINTGQYGFRGNNDINWRISTLLTAKMIRKNLLINDEEGIYFFN
jgi:hypothetical protein